MAPTVPAVHDPALSHIVANANNQQPPQGAPGIGQNILGTDISQINSLDPNQIMNLLRSLPGVFNKLTEAGKEDAAQTLSNLAQAPYPPGTHQLPVQQHPYPGPQHPGTGMPGINDPGPSSHPRGPPNLGQLSAVAMSAAPASGSAPRQPTQLQGQAQEMEESEDDRRVSGQSGASGVPIKEGSAPATTTRARGGRSATMGSDEWSRQRKDNHKEVERRRRGNINEGINELGRIVPNGSGEKAKGAILSRAVQYIHHLKENEARNIEKWTLEKLLMDQAMGDLQTQLEEVKRMWDEERMARQRAENELEVLRGVHHAAVTAAGAGGPNTQQNQNPNQNQNQNQNQAQNQSANGKTGEKRDGDAAESPEADRDGKRQRTE